MADTITLDTPAEQPKPEAPAAPSREDLRAKGWTAKEMDSAEKLGVIQKSDEPKKDEKPPEPKKDEKPPEPKPAARLPDVDLTPEQERVLTETFGPGTQPRALYFRMKNERKARQNAEARIRELETAIKEIKAPPASAADPAAVEDLENQPLTLKTLKEMQRQAADEARRQEEETQGRSTAVKAAIEEQEAYARETLPEFDAVVERAKDLIQNLDERIQDPRKRAKVIKLVRDLQAAAFQADKFGLDDYNASAIAYEIGELHPDHGQAPKTGAPKDAPKADGRLTPEQMRRVEQNTQRRTPSAALPAGGGQRTVSVEDVTLKDLNDMDYKKRAAFRQKYPEAYARLLRG